MKNMSPSVTRPASIVTKTVDSPMRKGKPMPGNNGPCCVTCPDSESVGNGVSKDVKLRSERTVYTGGF